MKDSIIELSGDYTEAPNMSKYNARAKRILRISSNVFWGDLTTGTSDTVFSLVRAGHACVKRGKNLPRASLARNVHRLRY